MPAPKPAPTEKTGTHEAPERVPSSDARPAPRRRSTLERAAQASTDAAATGPSGCSAGPEPSRRPDPAPPPKPASKPEPMSAPASVTPAEPSAAPLPEKDGEPLETAGADETGRDEFTLMRRFVGDKKADRFDRLYRQYEEDGHVIGWNWAAFLLGPVWLFYRKLEVEGALYIVVPAVLLLLSIWLAPIVLIGYVLLCLFANQYYLYRAERRIYAIEQQPVTAEERDTRLRARGGTTVRGALGAAVLVVGLIAGFQTGPTWTNIGPIMASLGSLSLPSFGGAPQTVQTGLPECGSPRLQQTVQNLVLRQLASLNLSTEGVRTGNFSEISATPDERNCKMTLIAGGQATDYRVKVLWQDVDRSRYTVQLAPL